jgi:ankyrin repeat protein
VYLDTALHIACAEGQLECVKLLCEASYAGIINKQSSSDSATPLLRCCENGSLEVAKVLLDAGADIDAKNVQVLLTLFLFCALLVLIPFFKGENSSAFML